MKKFFGFAFLGLLLAGAACTEIGPETINVIDDHYTEPSAAVVLSKVESAVSEWKTDKRIFNLSFSGEGSSLEAVLVGFDALLAPGQYVLAGEGAQIGQARSIKIGGKAATAGSVTVGKKVSGYEISAEATVDGVRQVVKWAGTLPLAPDPDPVMLTVVQSAQSNLANGIQSLTMNLATDGITQEFDMATYQQVWKGEGGYLALDIFSDDGYLHEGSYKPCAEGGVIGAGEFGIGYDTEVEFWGQMYPVENWGTCWWTVSGGAATATKILDGIVTVSRDGDDWVIAWGSKYPQEYVFKGAIPALTKPSGGGGQGGGSDIKLTYTDTPADCYDPSFAVVSGVKKHCINVVDGDNTVLYLELVRNEGDEEIEGEYESAEYARVAGQLANGFDLGFMNGGSFYITEDGSKVYIGVGAKVSVKKLVKGAYQFTGEGFDVIAAGPDYVPGSYTGGGDNPGGGGDFDGVTLTKLIQFQDNNTSGSALLTLQFATDGVSMVTEGWTTSYQGVGNYLALDIYSTSAVLEAGTYTACSEGGNVGPGQFGIGWDPGDLWGIGMIFENWGTCWWTVNNGTTSAEKVLDGTVVVEKDGDTYTLTLTSSAVNARYVGPIAAL